MSLEGTVSVTFTSSACALRAFIILIFVKDFAATE